MTIVVVAFRDDPGRAVAYKKFSGYSAVQDASRFYRSLLEKAQFDEANVKPRVISTRIIVDD